MSSPTFSSPLVAAPAARWTVPARAPWATRAAMLPLAAAQIKPYPAGEHGSRVWGPPESCLVVLLLVLVLVLVLLLALGLL